MSKGFAEYNAILHLLHKYGLVFRSNKEYEEYVKDLLMVLEL